MTPSEAGNSPQISRGSRFGRIAAIGALVLAVIAIAVVLLGGGDDGNNYRLLFETGGQLVEDNEVLIGGAPVGTVDEIELTRDGQAEVVHHRRPAAARGHLRGDPLDLALRQSPTATSRSPPAPTTLPALDDDELITQVDTTTPVDLDQLFNALREPERKGLQDIIQGSATVYAGRSAEANETYRYLSPSLTATDPSDPASSTATSGSSATSSSAAPGSSPPSASAATTSPGWSPTATRRSARSPPRTSASDRALVALPPALRQANTTFVNLRPTLDDLDPLVETARDRDQEPRPASSAS